MDRGSGGAGAALELATASWGGQVASIVLRVYKARSYGTAWHGMRVCIDSRTLRACSEKLSVHAAGQDVLMTCNRVICKGGGGGCAMRWLPVPPAAWLSVSSGWRSCHDYSVVCCGVNSELLQRYVPLWLGCCLGPSDSAVFDPLKMTWGVVLRCWWCLESSRCSG